MNLLSSPRLLRAAFLLPFLAFVSFGQSNQSDSDGIRIELPSSSRVRIENQFGEVVVEVWQADHVSVAATIDGTSPRRSPVVIENRKSLLAIGIVRRLTDPAAAIKLIVKIPANAQVEIITGKHPATMRGMPASASLRSTSGRVNVEFVATANADIDAKSVSGMIRSDLPQLQVESGNVLQARAGRGGPGLKIESRSGDIILSVAAAPRTADRRREYVDLEPPTKAVGTPAPLSDAQEISEGDIIRVDSQMVTLNMSVIDRNTNRGLAGLTKSDFRLFENGTEQQILQFESSAAPFDLVLLIDVSGSTRDVLKLIRAAALRFVDAARPFDRIGVIAFAGRPVLVTPLTLNRQTLRRHVNSMDTASGDTKLYDATAFALSQIPEEPRNRRRTAIIVMSDGLDGSIEGVLGAGSSLPYKDLLSRVQEFDGVIYTLWLNTEYEALSPLDTQPEAFDAGHARMKEVADLGGGLFYEVDRLQDLAGAYERVVADLGTVYSLAYRPSDKARDGKWRAISVNVARPSAVARGKRGYYAN